MLEYGVYPNVFPSKWEHDNTPIGFWGTLFSDQPSYHPEICDLNISLTTSGTTVEAIEVLCRCVVQGGEGGEKHHDACGERVVVWWAASSVSSTWDSYWFIWESHCLPCFWGWFIWHWVYHGLPDCMILYVITWQHGFNMFWHDGKLVNMSLHHDMVVQHVHIG